MYFYYIQLNPINLHNIKNCLYSSDFTSISEVKYDILPHKVKSDLSYHAVSILLFLYENGYDVKDSIYYVGYNLYYLDIHLLYYQIKYLKYIMYFFIIQQSQNHNINQIIDKPAKLLIIDNTSDLYSPLQYNDSLIDMILFKHLQYLNILYSCDINNFALLLLSVNEVIKEIIENLSVIYEKIYNEVYKSDIDDDYLILKSLYNKIDKYNI